MDDKTRALVLSLAERLFICSRLLTAAAERLSWDNGTVQVLMDKLRDNIEQECRHAGVEQAE